jgi:hypothetical protein
VDVGAEAGAELAAVLRSRTDAEVCATAEAADSPERRSDEVQRADAHRQREWAEACAQRKRAAAPYIEEHSEETEEEDRWRKTFARKLEGLSKQVRAIADNTAAAAESKAAGRPKASAEQLIALATQAAASSAQNVALTAQVAALAERLAAVGGQHAAGAPTPEAIVWHEASSHEHGTAQASSHEQGTAQASSHEQGTALAAPSAAPTDDQPAGSVRAEMAAIRAQVDGLARQHAAIAQQNDEMVRLLRELRPPVAAAAVRSMPELPAAEEPRARSAPAHQALTGATASELVGAAGEGRSKTVGVGPS